MTGDARKHPPLAELLVAWDAAGNTEPPTALGQSFNLNPTLDVSVLHAGIWKDNPSGVFEDWNPWVSCPEMDSSDTISSGPKAFSKRRVVTLSTGR